MDVLVASAAGGDLAERTRRVLTAAGHTVRPVDRRDVEGCRALVVAVGAQLDTEGLVDLMQVLAEARRLAIPVVGVSDCPTDKHPPAIAALQLESGWIEMWPDGDSSELVAALSVSARIDEPEPPRLRVFVSYSRRDETLVRPLIGELRERRIEVWLDTDAIGTGDRWRASIERGIRACDAVVVFLSPNVIKHPERVLDELGVAQGMDKRILPVRIKRMPAPPDGFGLLLSGAQTIDLFPDYDAGVARLVKDLGGDDGRRRVAGVLLRARRTAQRARRFAEQHDLARHAAGAGVAVLATVAAAAAAWQQSEKTRQHAENAAETAKQKLAREQYTERTIRLLTDGMKEMQASTGLTRPEQYQRDVHPRMMRIIGNLEAGRPRDADLAFTARHDQLVRDLENLVAQFDVLFDRIARGETDLDHSVRRLNDAWSNTVVSAVRWLEDLSRSE